MTITTKYNPEDVVFLIVSNAIKEVKINSFKITSYATTNTPPAIHYYIGALDRNYSENEVYATKELAATDWLHAQGIKTALVET